MKTKTLYDLIDDLNGRIDRLEIETNRLWGDLKDTKVRMSRAEKEIEELDTEHFDNLCSVVMKLEEIEEEIKSREYK